MVVFSFRFIGAKLIRCGHDFTNYGIVESASPESLPYVFDRYYKGASIAFCCSESSGIGLLRTQKSYWSYIRQPFNVRVNWERFCFYGCLAYIGEALS